MKATVAVFGTPRFPAENIESLLPHLQELVKQTYAHDGCIIYDVAEDPFNKGLIRFSELWPNRESLEQHLIAPHIAPWREQAKKHGLSDRQFHSYDIVSEAVAV